MLIYIGAIVAVLLLVLLYHYIPSRRIFFCFFFRALCFKCHRFLFLAEAASYQ